MFIHDQVLQEAICPEKRTGFNDQLTAVASVPYVHVTNDLQVAKIYVSIYSDEVGKATAMKNLKRVTGYVRREIGRRVSLRLVPDIRFEYDDSIDQSELVLNVLGDKEVARFKRELAEEYGEEMDKYDDLISAEADAQRGGAGPSGRGADGDDDEGFFDIDDADEEDMEEEEESFFSRPGPFDDLFTGTDTRDLEKAAQRKRDARQDARRSIGQ